MKDTKKILWTISIYNPTATAEKLEELAAEGWMFEKTGNPAYYMLYKQLTK